MKPFDIKIDCFGDLNLPQQFSLSEPGSNDLISLLHKKKKKTKKKKLSLVPKYMFLKLQRPIT
jgi:hypothetical protein